MTITLLLHPYGEKERSGLGRAAYCLARAMVESAPEHKFDIVVKDPGAPMPDFMGNNWTLRRSSGKGGWMREMLNNSAADAHVFFTPMMPLGMRIKNAVVIAHDFAYLTLPGDRAPLLRRIILRYLHGRALRRANIVVAVSEATKKEIERLFHIAPERIKVVYDGVADICGAEPSPIPGIERPFFLFAGVMKERKNVDTILRAFALIVGQGFSGSLVLAGKKSGAYGARMEMLARQLGVGERVKFVGFVSDQGLSYLYREALAFVFPSRLEGFGMAALEAMHCGVPTIASKGGALGEAVGEGALLVNPESAEDVAQAMQKLQDETTRAEYSARGRERAAEFTWERAGKELLSIIGRL